jgi:hypothetical protein
MAKNPEYISDFLEIAVSLWKIEAILRLFPANARLKISTFKTGNIQIKNLKTGDILNECHFR